MALIDNRNTYIFDTVDLHRLKMYKYNLIKELGMGSNELKIH